MATGMPTCDELAAAAARGKCIANRIVDRQQLPHAAQEPRVAIGKRGGA
jgi:hypothetical protein